MAFLCHDRERMSNSLTAVVCEIANTDELLRLSEERLIRIGHLGVLNELEVLATLSGVELALDMAGEKVELGSGVAAAQKWFQQDGW